MLSIYSSACPYAHAFSYWHSLRLFAHVPSPAIGQAGEYYVANQCFRLLKQ